MYICLDRGEDVAFDAEKIKVEGKKRQAVKRSIYQ
jgi:hypothetical protein